MRLRRLAVALLPLAFSACLEGTDTITYPNVPIEQTTFASSLNVNLAQSTKTASGLYYRDLTVGTGAVATSTSKVNLYYQSYLSNGQLLAQVNSPSTPQSVTLGANQIIPGWEEGMVGMKAGGSRQLIIPPSLAYGNVGYNFNTPSGAQVFVPPFSVIVINVTLDSVQ